MQRLEAALPPAGSEPVGTTPRAGGRSRLAESIAGLRGFGRRHRTPIAVVGSLATAAVLVFLLAGRRHEFEVALSSAPLGLLAVTALLQIVALVARSEAWHLTIEEATGTVDRRVLYRASSMQVLGSVVNGQLGWPRGSQRCGARPQPSARRCRHWSRRSSRSWPSRRRWRRWRRSRWSRRSACRGGCR